MFKDFPHIKEVIVYVFARPYFVNPCQEKKSKRLLHSAGRKKFLKKCKICLLNIYFVNFCRRRPIIVYVLAKPNYVG